MEDTEADSTRDGPDSEDRTRRVERSFTCTACGYGMTHSVGRLRAGVQSTCVNCGDWTVQRADVEDLVNAARDVAEWFGGTILTERQSLAFLLRDVAGVGRQRAAAVMDTTPSNVDNLQRRGREKVADARRLVENVQTLGADAEER